MVTARFRAYRRREAGADYFDLDEYCERLMAHNPGIARDAATLSCGCS
jgi:hypothetical protein